VVIRRGCIGLALGVIAGWSSSVSAQAVDPREAEARKQCMSGKAEAGTTLLAELFAETANPNFVFNQARCFELNGKYDDAINRFREYLRVAGSLTADERTEVERHIAECYAMKAQQGGNPGEAVTRPITPPAPVEGAAGGEAPVAAMLAVPAAASSAAGGTAPVQPAGGGSLRHWGMVAGAIGIVGVGTGIAFGAWSQRIESEVERDGRKGFFDPDKDARGRRYATLQWVGYGVGAAGLLTGTILYVVGWRAGRQALALVPVAGSGEAGVALQGRY
jgi:hypothetical protein